MNCTDSVLNSDELPVRGIDQCPSTPSTQPSPGLVLGKWNRLPALFTTARLNSCFVEAEAFLKCVNLLAIEKILLFCPSPFHSLNLVLLILAPFFFLPPPPLPNLLPYKILDVSDSCDFLFGKEKKDTKMHSDAATSSSFSLNLDGFPQSVQ